MSVTGDGPSGGIGGNAAPAAISTSGLGSGDCRVGDRDSVSRFGPLGDAVVPRVEARSGAATSSRDDGTAVVADGNFQLMYVRLFLCKVGEGTIPERVYEGD